jgi:hypothetical protein
MTQTIPAAPADTVQAAPAAAPKRPRPENPYADAYADFRSQVGDHVLTVSKDDGLYRQMRVGAPDAGHWAWRVITWPGYVATYGDIADGYMFTRTSDMIDFFDREGHGAYYSDGSPSIDFRYWAEKLSGNGRSQDVKEYSEKRFIQHVHDRLEEHHDLGTEAQDEYEKIVAVSKRVTARHEVDYEEWLVQLRAGDVEATCLEIDPDSEDEAEFFGLPIPEKSPLKLREELIADARENSETEDEAREWLREKSEIVGQDDFWEAQLRDFNVHFLFTAYAIEMTVRLWREYEKSNDRKALAVSTQATDRGLIELARARVDAEFKISTDLGVGDISNGALVLRLAEALAEQISARPAHIDQPAA